MKKISTIFFCLCCFVFLSITAQSQDFLNRNYLQSFPGADINWKSSGGKIDSANRKMFKGNFLEKSINNKTVLQKKQKAKITVAPFWKLNGDSIARHLQKDSLKINNLQNARLSGTTDKNSAGTLYAELLSDFTGLWRISLASAVTATTGQDSTNAETAPVKDIQNFFVGGGNIIVKGSFPLMLFFNTRYRHTRNTGIYFVPKAGVSFPAFGTAATDPIWNLDTGIEIEAFGGGIRNQIGVYGRLRDAGVWASREFTQQILADGRRFFGYGQANVGAMLQDKLYININFPVSVPITIFGREDPIDRLPVSVSTGVLF